MIEIERYVTDKVTRTLGGFPEISLIHTTNGRWDILFEVSSSSLIKFDTVIRKIRLGPGITGSDTSLHLSTPRSTKAKL